MPIVAPPITSLGAMAAHPLKAAKFIASLFVGNDIVYGQGKVRIIGRSFADTDRDNEAGYRAIQGTRPYTLAYGLTDSPIGLLGKFSNYSLYPTPPITMYFFLTPNSFSNV
jgi:hypothetical protein